MSDNNISDAEKDLSTVMELPHLSKTRKAFMDDLVNSSNENSDNIDDYKSEIIGAGEFKDKLDPDDYLDLIAFGPKKCGPGRKRRWDHDETCKECKADRGYDNTPSSLRRLVRNVDAHAPPKMKWFPDGATKKKLYPDDYANKNSCVDFWTGSFPNLFLINSYLRKGLKPPTAIEVVTELRNAIDNARDHGLIVTKFGGTQLDQGGMQKIEVLLAPDILKTNYGKVVTVTRRRLEVKHSSGETLSFKVSYSRHPGFLMVFGLETLKTTKLSSSHVVLLTTQSESVDHVSKVLTSFGNYQEVHLKWCDISNDAQLRLKTEGKIVIRNHTYTAKNFRLDKLEGSQLVEILKTGTLEVFGPDTINANYVARCINMMECWVPCANDDSVYFVVDMCGSFPSSQHQCLEITTDNELFAMDKLTAKFVIFKYFASVTKLHDKIVQLSAGRSHRFIILSLLYKDNNKCARVIVDRDFLQEVKASLVFLEAGAGEGKTETLKYLHSSGSLQKTVFLHASAKRFMQNYSRDVPALDCVANACGLNDFETETMKVFQKVLLIDALDEVEPLALADAKSLIHSLVRVSGLRVVVSVRRYLIEELKIEYSFAHFWKLSHLTKDSQVAICYSHMHHLAKGREISESFAHAIVLSYDMVFQWKLTALICKMIAEVYVDLKPIEQ